MEWVTVIAAVIGAFAAITAAVAAIYAAIKSASTAKALQTEDHEFHSQQTREQHCTEIHSRFVREVRTLTTYEWPDGPLTKHTITMSIMAMAEAMMNRATNAGPIVDEMAAFCPEDTATAAREATAALTSYGAQWLLLVMGDDTERPQLEANLAQEGNRYRTAFATYQETIRSHHQGDQ